MTKQYDCGEVIRSEVMAKYEIDLGVIYFFELQAKFTDTPVCDFITSDHMFHIQIFRDNINSDYYYAQALTTKGYKVMQKLEG